MRVTDEAAPEQVSTIGKRIMDATIDIPAGCSARLGAHWNGHVCPLMCQAGWGGASANLSSIPLEALIVACAELLMSYRRARGTEDFLQEDQVL
jgi:hypothetical protein